MIKQIEHARIRKKIKENYEAIETILSDMKIARNEFETKIEQIEKAFSYRQTIEANLGKLFLIKLTHFY